MSDPPPPPPGSPPPSGYLPPPGWASPPPPGSPPPGWTSPPPYAPWGAYPAPAPNPFESQALIVMILGILSIVSCGLLGPVAWVLGRRLRADASSAGYAEPGQGKAGRICGMVGTALLILQAAWIVFFFAFVFGSGFR